MRVTSLTLLLALLGPPTPAQETLDILGQSWTYAQVVVPNHVPRYRFQLTQVSGNDAELYVRRGGPPTLAQHDARSRTKGTSNETLVLDQGTTPRLATGVWWVGVLKKPATVVNSQWTAEAAPALHAGMGATVFDDGWPLHPRGVTFRVWAPHAQAVHVGGDFNGWSGTQAALASEGNGNWSLDYRSISAGGRYRYAIDTGASTLWRMDPHARQVTDSVGDSVIVDPDLFAWTPTSFATPPWNEMVIYEMHLGAFNDAPRGGPGTLASAQQKIAYLADLGVNVIELMPLCEFAGDFSWGYNYSHPYAPESAYGSPDDVRAFIDAAHQQDIAVVLDVLYNHWGPSDLDMWTFDGWSIPPWGGIYFYNDNRAQTPWGDTRPDYGRPEVRSYIHDNALFWLQDYRFDGLRWDSTSYMRRDGNGNPIADAWSLMQWTNDDIDAQQGWKISIAEDMWTNDWITKSTGAGGAGFDSQWDPQFVHPVRGALEAPNDNARDMWAVSASVGFAYNGQPFQRVIYTESHDEVANGRTRVPEAIWPGNASSWFSKKRSTLGAALVMTAPGIPMIFMGQEFLEDGYFADDDPLDWSKLQTYAGIHAMYRDLIRLRRNWFNETAGLRGSGLNVFHVNDTDKVIAFHRWDQGGVGDDVIVLANFRNQSWTNYTIGLPGPGTWRVRFNSDASVYDPGFGNHPSWDLQAQPVPYDGLPYSASLSFGPYTALILSR